MNENINIPNNNKIPVWLCEKCQNLNQIIDIRCLKCNYFNYDAYIEKYKDSDNIEEIEDSKNQKVNEKPIILIDEYIDYNFKENYERKRQEKHKFIKCWHCGKENFYYKVKCTYCRFPINDEKIPKIKKTQLSKYDIINNIQHNNKSNKKCEEKNRFGNIEIKCNNPIKENLIYKDKSSNWECRFCKKFNKKTIKFCEYCFKNRL